MPEELYECAFDIISSIPHNLMMETELIYIVWEIFNDIPQLKDRSFIVRLNHSSIVEGILMHYQLDSEQCKALYKLLHDAQEGKYTRSQVEMRFTNLPIASAAMQMLFRLYDDEGNLEHITNSLRPIFRMQTEGVVLVKKALKDLEIIITNLQRLDMRVRLTKKVKIPSYANIFQILFAFSVAHRH